ncbi:MAG: phage major tail protein, TP901-1 family [Allobaculum sp.]|uniref:phage major tail protein, TP901-1 family n=1 Tax=Allobaculum sp. TaxID=1872463 RepID=UPI00399A77F2
MNSFDLQRFAETAEPVKGKKIFYLIRRYSKRTQETAKTVAFQTEGSRTMSKDADSVATKDGTIRVPGAGEVEISLTSLVTEGDGVHDDLEEAMESGELMEIWEVNVSEKGTDDNADKYKARYHQGYLTSLELSASAEDFAELSQTYSINGMGVKGYVTLTQEQKDIVQYLFEDTAKVTE